LSIYYIDNLLVNLAQSGVGCYIGTIFVGALAYADDIVLMFNAKCMIVYPPFLQPVVSHLGHIITNRFDDTDDIFIAGVTSLVKLIASCVISMNWIR